MRSCGDGVRGVGEVCDDGNTDPDDGCDATCRIEPGWGCFEPPGSPSQCTNTCGDGRVDYPAEQCDEGEANSDTAPNACRVVCRLASCGDAVLDDGETCDEGTSNSPTEPNACRPTCQVAFCGDGIVDEGEVCDPGLGEELPAERCAQRCFADAGRGGGNGGCSALPQRERAAYAWLGLLVAGLLTTARRRTRRGPPAGD